MSFAQITLIGRLGKDPEIRMTQAGKQITSASVAVSGKDKSSTWFNVAAWEATGKWLVEAKKGDLVFVQGDLEAKTYQRKDGTNGTELMVNARTIRAMSQRKEEPYMQAGQKMPEGDFTMDDIPF